jgi:hypothetical protein
MMRALLEDCRDADLFIDGGTVWICYPSADVRVIPSLKRADGRYIINLDNTDEIRVTDPDVELAFLNISNVRTKGNTRNLIKMVKTWREFCDVPITSFQIELLSIYFLDTWLHYDMPWRYYDLMIRDFFLYVKSKGNSSLRIPGSGASLPLGRDWLASAEIACFRALRATEFEARGQQYTAGDEWQKIFGRLVPLAHYDAH